MLVRRLTTVIISAALALGVTACAHESVSPPVPTYTATLRVIPGVGTTSINYTCEGPDQSVSTCTAAHKLSNGAWEQQVTVPMGAMIRVQVSGGDTTFAGCSINDSTGTLTLDSHQGPACHAEAR